MTTTDIEISARDWVLAQKLVRNMKEIGFDALGLDDETVVYHKAISFTCGASPSGAIYTQKEAEAVIAAAFEELNGMTPQAYWEKLDNKPEDVVQMVKRREEARRHKGRRKLPIIIWDIPE